MDNYTIGDLTDIVRASGAGPEAKSIIAPQAPPLALILAEPSSWHGNNTKNHDGSFGDPFSDMKDPFFHGLDRVFFSSSSSSSLSAASGPPMDMIDVACRDDVFVPNVFTRMLHKSAADRSLSATAAGHHHHHQLPVSPLSSDSPVVADASSFVKEIKINSSGQALVGYHHRRGDVAMGLNRSKGCLMDSTNTQIPSPSNSGIKRRKSQAKKVICIPAPAAANSRASGEVVPSDLWAWRKYGQKPIKGSPYPRQLFFLSSISFPSLHNLNNISINNLAWTNLIVHLWKARNTLLLGTGYYRCSSSKGCSARKQVERSRADPNMLVITYTSEHNHPWPTQRNALAGSTRSMPSRANNSTANNPKASRSNPPTPLSPKEAMATANDQRKETDSASANTTTSSLKEEMKDAERHVEINGGEDFNSEFSLSYRRLDDPEEASSSDDFFADLGEIDGDPSNHLLFSHGFGEGGKDNKGLDPFGIFELAGRAEPFWS
ncbi:hypothetical protein SAY87_004673 [Trapa incisa]|uniref:WRKY domain-containing protein n=1 Tax=Trapa incisa TaxID=236973 RepID=A0AAN7JPA1_9MYRT|nr:hypothetical protein SAY87_004673 [Trapa incisa]